MATHIIKDPRDPEAVFLVSDESLDHIRGGHVDPKTATGSFFNEDSDVLEMLRVAARVAPHPTKDNRVMEVGFFSPIGYDATCEFKGLGQEAVGALMKFQSNSGGASPGHMSLVLAPAVASANFGEGFSLGDGFTRKLTAIAGATDFSFVDEETAAKPEVQAARDNDKCFSFLTAYPGEPCQKIADMDLLAGRRVFMAKPGNPSFVDLEMAPAVASDFIKKFNAASLQGNLDQEKQSPDALRSLVEKAAQEYRDGPRRVVGICKRVARLRDMYSMDREYCELGKDVAEVPGTPFFQLRFDFNDNTSVVLGPEFDSRGNVAHYSLSSFDEVGSASNLDCPFYDGNMRDNCNVPDFHPEPSSVLDDYAVEMAGRMLSSPDTERFCPQATDAADLGRRIAHAIASYPATVLNDDSASCDTPMRLESLPKPWASATALRASPAPAIDMGKLRGSAAAAAPSDKHAPKA